ncbi:MAG: HAMP domain-containing sensor histidine kinase [Roseiarcus sp.]|uniref:sensor histidine kinase n=1 Tax=Roseiarcus sp. TaxID=1969460 RepID=UPI003BB07D89
MTALGKLFRATAFRLALAILALSAIGAGLVLAVIAWQVISVVNGEIEQTIDAEAKGLIDTYMEGGLRQLGAVIEMRARQPGASLYLLTDFGGDPLAGNVQQIPLGVLDRPGFLPIGYSTNVKGDRSRQALVGIYLLSGGLRLLIGHDLGDRARIEKVMVRALAISLVFFAALAALGALFVARRVLRRIDAINISAHRIMAGDLTQRLPVSGSGDELDRLAEGLNEMLARIGELMQGLREVSDNIAHDLRTPLTRLRNHAEAALAFGGDAAAYRTALEKTIEESDALIKIFNALLLIARAEAGGGVEAQSFDVGEAVRSVAELYEPIAEEEGVDLKVETKGALTVLGNRELVAQTIANLVDNALKYGAPEAGAEVKPEVVISARRVGASVEFAIADRGPGIDLADRARVLERFVRLEGSRSRPGSGLGLSLAAAVARMHGGTVELEDNHPGLRVCVALPAEEESPRLPAPASGGVHERHAG